LTSSSRSARYDPRIASLIENTDLEWGDPDENRRRLVYYGINYIDQALFGIDFVRGEMIGIQAEAKQRKSTLLANIVLCVASQLSEWVCIDTLESGMPPSAYRDVLIAIKATRMMIADVFGTDRKEWPRYADLVAHPELGKELRISKEFLWYGRRTERQFHAIAEAKRLLAGHRIMLFGPAPTQGNARSLPKSLDRWHRLYHGEYAGVAHLPVRMFAVDHVQQLSGFGDSDYNRLESAVHSYSDFVTTHPGSVVFVVSQLGVGSVRLEKQGIARAQAKGGAVLEAEVNVLFRTLYDSDGTPHVIRIQTDATRKRPPPMVAQEIEPNSGSFLRPASPTKNY
jgi:hypothetical protein